MFGGGGGEEAAVNDSIAFSSSGTTDKVLDGSSADAFWNAEREWQRSELSKAFTITISEPQQVNNAFLGSYTTYLLQSQPLCPEGVRRRYSDWDWLRELLVARYHGIAVPLLPEKRVVGNQNKNFIEERMQGLENWCVCGRRSAAC